MKVELKNWSHLQFQPSKQGDVGHDLHSNVMYSKRTFFERLFSEIVGWPFLVVWPFQSRTIATGIAVSQPSEVWCHVTARSSSARKGLLVFTGIIDSGYQGELFAVIRNLGFIPRIIRQNERYAQVIFHPAVRPDFVQVAEFNQVSARADTGFGSSGK